MEFIDIAVPVPLRQTFTYCYDTTLPAGVRVRVPFGNREVVGVVLGSAVTPDKPDKIKPLLKVLDESPVFDEVQLGLCQWLSQYYHHAPGEVYHTAMPVLLRKGEAASLPALQKLTATANADTEALASLSRAPRQQACLQKLKLQSGEPAAVRQEFGASAVKALLDKGLIEEVTEVSSPQNWHSLIDIGDKPLPDKEQAVAIAAINQSADRFSAFLLEGVTGSGKTEVYLQAIEPVLQKGRQVLILVPEIGLTPQTVGRFEKRFGIEVGVLHSQLSDKARLAVWARARENDLGLIIGTRSAIFTPLANPGMIIVDEEHDDSFKQQDGLRYHARDLALVRARRENIPVVLGTATPSLETLNNALNRRYHHLTLTRRAGGAQHTHQQVLDARDQHLDAGIAQGTLALMKTHLQAGNQVLVFVNRRGYAPALLCHHCGETMMCRRCERPYTVHKAARQLQCHHCCATRPMPHACEHCHSDELVTAGVGTEQVEQALGQHFPGIRQVRIDSDSVRGKDKFQALLSDINHGKYQLLIGTQILSKGHHFPNVTLVVILDCDGALFSADFRAPEKLAQLVTQLAGRAGRATKPGEMWLQTHNPEHPLLQDLIHNGYHHFARHALSERNAAGLPPFSAQCLIRAESSGERQAFEFLQQVRTLLRQHDISVFGPVPCLIEKRQGRYRFMLQCQSASRQPLHEALRLSLPYINALPDSARVRWSLDVDPQDMS